MKLRNYKTRFATQWLIAILLFCVQLISTQTTMAQCTNTSSYGSATAPATTPASVNFSTCSYAGEYSTLSSVVAGTTYRVSSSVATDYITVRSTTSGGAVVAAGVSPLTFTATVSGTYYCHWSSNSACGTQSTCRTTTVARPGTGCTNASSYGSATASAVAGTTVNFSTCSYAGEYSTANSLIAGNVYRFNSSVTTDYVTIHSGSAAGPIVAAGGQPLFFQPTANGTYYAHWNTNSACGTQNTCRTTQITTVSTSAAACSGTPNAGTITASVTSACSATNFTLTATGLTSNTNFTGISYQWQVSTDGGINWVNATGTGVTTASATVSQTVASQYRIRTTCSGSALSNFSNVLSIGMNVPTNCYCASGATSTADEEISNVSIGTLNNSSVCGTLAPDAGSVAYKYSNYTVSVAAPALERGNSYTISATQTSCGGPYGNVIGAWIDYNQNGVFTDPGEQILLSAYVTGNQTATASVLIPANATPGNTRMRVVTVESSSVSPCGTYTWGETEDYTVNITIPAPCIDPPNAGVVSASAASVCSGSAISFSNLGYGTGVGIAYQWQFSADNISWSNITGATLPSYSIASFAAGNAGYYRLSVSCSGGNPSYSNAVQVGLNPPTQCYCAATNTYGCVYGDLIAGVTLNTLVNNSGTTCNGTYVNYTTNPSLTTTLAQGYTYQCIVSTGSYGQDFAAWIDGNDDGVFDASERIGYTLSTVPAFSTASFPVVVNCNSVLGTHRLRVRSAYAQTGSTINPCGSTTYNYGETEDYLVTYVAGTTIYPVATNIAGPTTGVCSPVGSGNNVLSYAIDAGYSGAIQWQYSLDGSTYIDITNATAATQGLVASGPLNAYIRVKFTGQGCIPPAYSNAINVVVSAPVSTIATTGSNICRGASATLTANSNISGPYAWSNNTNLQSTTVSPLATTTYTVTVGSGLCTSTASETVTIIGGPVATSALTPTALSCPGSQVDLTSQLIAGLPGGTYNGSPITYAPVSISGTAGPSGDDVLSGAVALPFNFTFYGNTYSNIYISTNGFISFDAGAGSGCCSGQLLPSTLTPNNVIALAWDDLNAQVGGITYASVGTAPNRVFVIDYNNVPHFGGGGSNITGQIHLYESTNVIEIHTGQMTNDGSNHTQGIENAAGTLGNAVPGRNSTPWNGANDAYRFSPDPGVTFTYVGPVTYTWSGSNGFSANTQNATDNPTATTTYTLTVADDLCSSSTTVTKNVFPAPSVFAFNGGPYCEGGNALFFGFGSSAAVGNSSINYTFQLTDSYGDGWNGATMEVRQGSTVITTLGPTFTTGSSLNVTVSLAGSTNYSLVYTGSGSYPSEVGIQVLDNNSNNVYSLAAGAGTVGNTLYSWTTAVLPPAGVTYSWTGPNGFTSTDQNPLVSGLSASNAGQYDVVITDANNCTASAIDFLTVNDNPDVDYTTFTNETCPGYADGSMEIGISGGDGSYSISDGGLYSTFGSPAQFSGVAPGTYFFSISDGNLCGTTTSITVGIEPNIPPVLVGTPSNISLNAAANACGAVATFTAPTATDNCPVGLGNVIQTAGLPSGSLFPVGTTVNTFSVTDAEGATVTSSFSVTVSDINAPAITNVPANISSCNPVSWTVPTITDNCAGVITTSTHVPGTNFPSGTTTVTYTATDVYGNTSSASFNVTVLEPSTAATSVTSNRDFNNICLGENITLTVNGGSLGEQASWKWYRTACGGATNYVGQGTSVTVTPTVTTTYYVRAEGLCNTTACQSITVIVTTGAPSASPTFSTLPTAAAPGVNSTVCVNPVPGATFYQWFTQNGHNQSILFNGQVGPIQTNTNCVNVSFVLPQQNYFIRVFAGNACGRTSQTNAAGIRGTVSASTCINGPTQVCPGQTLSYTACAIPSQTSVSYNWQIIPAVPGTATISFNGTNATVNYLPGFTTAQICVNGISTFGLAGPSYCINVSTNAPTPGAITGLSTPCEGSTQTYSIAAVPNATSYTWSSNIAGAVVTGNGTSATVVFPANVFAGDVCVVANSSCGVSAPSCISITSGQPGVPGAISGPVSGICNASNVNYSLATSNANSYNWIVPAGVTISGPSNLNAVNLNFGAGFTGGTITVEAFYDCGSATSSITVDGAPDAPSLTPAVICPEASELYTASSTGATSYNWTLSGDDYSACTNPPTCSQYFVIWSVSGGSLSVTATNSCGTSPATAISGSSCRNEVGGLDSKVYPNPTNGKLFVEFRAQVAGEHNIFVTDLSGRIVFTTAIDANVGANLQEIDLSGANAGLYMVHVKDPKGTISVNKVGLE
ncbi:MAG: GEVED domain-containing protein [Arcticibacter sp.]